MLRRTGGCVAACLAAALLVTGCGYSGEPPKPTAKSSSTRPSPSPTASPRPDPSLQPPRVKAAVIPADKARQLGLGQPDLEKADAWKPDGSCGSELAEAHDITHSYHRQWSLGSKVGGVMVGKIVSHSVYAFDSQSPAASVATLRATTPKCGAYKQEVATVTYAGDVTLPASAGVDASYAFCLRTELTGLSWYRCDAFLARGNLLAAVSAFDTANGKKDPVRQLLLKVVPAAAVALAAA